jgi:SAM-dependent methyltransferase
MGLTITNLKFILKKNKEYKFFGPVLTLGNQDIYATDNDIKKWSEEYNIELNKPRKILYSTSVGVPKVNKEASQYIHAKTFFEFLGISEENYYDIDKFPFDKPKIIHDLQDPIDSKFHNFFNLIIDSGTMEHIFDAKSVMGNIARITNIGGYVLQFIPAQNFLNHGFHQFSPTFFYDFYVDNGFEIIESYVVEIRGRCDRFHFYTQEKDYTGLFFNPRNRLVNCFLVRKKEDVEKIISPNQYFYKRLTKDSKTLDEDFNMSRLDKTTNFLRKIIPIRYHGIFFSIWWFLKSKGTKRQYFDIKK